MATRPCARIAVRAPSTGGSDTRKLLALWTVGGKEGAAWGGVSGEWMGAVLQFFLCSFSPCLHLIREAFKALLPSVPSPYTFL